MIHPLRMMHMKQTRTVLAIITLFFGIFVLAACGSTPPTPAPATPVPATAVAAQGLQVLIANSRHLLGQDRFPIGIVRNGTSVKDAQVHLNFYDLTGSGDAVLKSESDAPFYGDNLGEAGVYVGTAIFDKAGEWGVEAIVTQPGFATETQRIGFIVLESDPSPAVGTQAPHTKTLTLADVNGDRTKISSADVDDRILHQLSIDTALTNGKPTVILFATPRFCQTRTCGPSHQVVMGLAENYATRVNFIHIEIFKNFDTFEVADAMREWNLESEPWLFFIDANGKIVRKYEGGITAKEIVPDFLEFIGG